MKKDITLRQLIELVEANDWTNNVFKYLYEKDSSHVGSKATFEKTKEGYSKVIAELKSKPSTRTFRFPILIRNSKDFFSKEKYIDVCFFNPRYVEPAKGLKPWGGNKPPKGHYNINLDKHNKYFAFGYTTWSKVIDSKIIVEPKKLKEWGCLAEILWELTFNGFTEKKNDEFFDFLKNRVKEVKEQVKKGKCTTLKRKTEKGFDVVIPDCVKDDVKKIVAKRYTPDKFKDMLDKL
jgi:hypothetical protein